MATIFIEETDYKPYITDARLQAIIGNDTDILENAEATAVAVVTDAIDGRYDSATIFATVGDDRSKTVIRWVINLVLYYLYERIPDKLVPERVVFNYKETLDMLEGISDGKKSVVLPRKEVEEGVSKTKLRWGSQTARSH